MADPNQTAERGDWACPCSGCQKAVAWERKQLIEEIKQLRLWSHTSESPYDDIVLLIENRMPKPKGKK
jgi:hypothetical protein